MEALYYFAEKERKREGGKWRVYFLNTSIATDNMYFLVIFVRINVRDICKLHAYTRARARNVYL